MTIHPLILSVQQRHLNHKAVNVRPGDTVRVHVRVVEGARERIQPFEGVVMRVRKGGLEKDFTVRRLTHGIGVERTFLLHSPRLERIEILRHGDVRRAQLYYLRDRVGKRARVKELRASRGGATKAAPETASGDGLATAPVADVPVVAEAPVTAEAPSEEEPVVETAAEAGGGEPQR